MPTVRYIFNLPSGIGYISCIFNSANYVASSICSTVGASKLSVPCHCIIPIEKLPVITRFILERSSNYHHIIRVIIEKYSLFFSISFVVIPFGESSLKVFSGPTITFHSTYLSRLHLQGNLGHLVLQDESTCLGVFLCHLCQMVIQHYPHLGNLLECRNLTCKP